MSDNSKVRDIFKEEDSKDIVLSKLENFLDKTKIIHSIRRELFFNDEPKLYDYCTAFTSSGCNKNKQISYAGGTDLDKEYALLKSLGEALERHCLSSKQQKDFFYPYKDIKEQAINIFELCDYNQEQQLNNNLYTENDIFSWCHGYNVFNFKECFIPSQLVYVPYHNPNEKILREPISTGAALSTSLGGSIYRGICEVIERDAFMISYLNQTKNNLVDLKRSGSELKELYKISRNYKLEPIIVDITSDLKIPTMISIVIDRTGLGPAVSVGLSADLDPKKAAIKSLKEAFHSRPWIRKLIIQKNKNTDINTFEGRAMYWSKPEMVSKLNFLIKGEKIPLKNEIKTPTMKEKLNKIKSIFDKNNISSYFVDLTTPEVKKYGFFVSKVIIPKLVPLYLNEKFKNIKYTRVKPEKINQIPHPFL